VFLFKSLLHDDEAIQEFSERPNEHVELFRDQLRIVIYNCRYSGRVLKLADNIRITAHKIPDRIRLSGSYFWIKQASIVQRLTTKGGIIDNNLSSDLSIYKVALS
jgi:hypothetical protein